ncbi:hypothetical protein ACTTAI_16630 [Rhodobacter capsulatus]|uniref:hypothetical protein n=1 Tax=Rhodobacter capsulatus TaxID=1061 RepID=UPI004025EAAF
MQPILYPKYQHVIESRGASASNDPALVVDQSARDTVFYMPFEYVNERARIVIVGITPGPNQMALAYDEVKALSSRGMNEDQILYQVKSLAAFGDESMRPNLVKMLNAMQINELIGIRDAGELWSTSYDALHATSVIPHAAFRNGKMFAGSFDQVLRSEAFAAGFQRDFLPSLQALPHNAFFLALGPTPLEALQWCVAQGHIQEEQLLGALAHPSRSSGSQVDIYLGLKDPQDLNPKDPVRYRVDWLQRASQSLRQKLRKLAM